MHAGVCVYIYIYMYVFVNSQDACMHACMHAGVCVYIHIYIYICMFLLIPRTHNLIDDLVCNPKP